MFESNDLIGETFDEDSAFDMLQELERNTPDEIRRMRAHFRIAVKVQVTLQPANASQMLKFRMRGTTGDISQGGCRILFPLPVRVGDIYRLEFDRQQLNVPMTFARCVRCHLLREDAYDAGFTFFTPIALPTTCSVAAHGD